MAVEQEAKRSCKNINTFHDKKKHDMKTHGMAKRAKKTPTKKTPTKKHTGPTGPNRDNRFLYSNPPSPPASTPIDLSSPEREIAELQKHVQRGSTDAKIKLKKKLSPEKPLEPAPLFDVKQWGYKIPKIPFLSGKTSCQSS